MTRRKTRLYSRPSRPHPPPPHLLRLAALLYRPLDQRLPKPVKVELTVKDSDQLGLEPVEKSHNDTPKR